MNAGMYGMADGRGMTGRKLIGSSYSGPTSPSSTGFLNAGTYVASSTGQSHTSLGLTAGVRIKVASITGKGAVRLLGFNASGVSIASLVFELWLDGQKVKQLVGNLSSGSGLLLIGTGSANSTYPSLVPDYAPFDSSCEIFITSDTTIASGSDGARYAHWIDLHQ